MICTYTAITQSSEMEKSYTEVDEMTKYVSQALHICSFSLGKLGLG